MANIIEIIARFINEASPGLKQVGGDVGDLGKKADGTKESATGLGNSWGSMLGELGMTLSIAGAAAGAFSFLKSSIDAYGESEVVAAQVNAVLQSTNEIAGVTAEEIDRVATSLSRMSGEDDEAIKRGEALLLTFTKIGSDVFPQATEAALNMSMAMGTDLQSSIIQVGKALNDPIEGASALRRVGVQLSDQQEEQIKQFMAVNDVASAQKIILNELSIEFGGVAEAMGDTTVGSINKLNVAWGNLMEAFGEGFAESGVTDGIVTLTENLENLNDTSSETRRQVELDHEAWVWVQTVQDDLALSGETLLETQNRLMAEYENRAALDEFRQSEIDLNSTMTDTVAVTEEYIPKLDEILNLSTKIADETERYNDKQQTLLEKQADIKGQIDELIALGWSPLSDKVKDLQSDYDELGVKYQENADKHNEAMGRIQYDLLITKLSVGGLEDAEYDVAQQAGIMFGVFDQKSVDSAKNMDLVIQAVMEGKLKVEDMQKALDLLPKMKSIDVVINAIANIGTTSGPNYNPYANGYNENAGRAGGGPVEAGKMYEVTEGGIPELLSFGGRQFLMTPPNADGYVIPPTSGGSGASGNGGSSNLTINIAVNPQGITIADEYRLKEMLEPVIIDAFNAAQANGLIPQ